MLAPPEGWLGIAYVTVSIRRDESKREVGSFHVEMTFSFHIEMTSSFHIEMTSRFDQTRLPMVARVSRGPGLRPRKR